MWVRSLRPKVGRPDRKLCGDRFYFQAISMSDVQSEVAVYGNARLASDVIHLDIPSKFSEWDRSWALGSEVGI